jgi:glycosyltransferase involved in cell wall biosynthesis
MEHAWWGENIWAQAISANPKLKRATAWRQEIRSSHHDSLVDMQRNKMAAPPQIAVIAPRGMRFSPTGATSIDLCIRDFVRFSRFHDATTVISNYVDAPFTDVETRFLGKAARSTKSRVREIAQHLRELDPDLIVVHQHIPSATGLRGMLPRTPIILHIHNFQRQKSTLVGRLVRAYQYKKFDAVVCVSEAVRDQFRCNWGHTQVPSFTAHNGIDTLEWTAEGTEKEKLILFAGRAAPEKGVLEAAGAVVEVLARAPEWRAEFLLSEVGQNRAYMAEIQRTLARGDGRISIITNATHDVVRTANVRAAIALVPSIFEEPFGRTAIEAMATRCALIFSRRGGLPEVVGSSGLGIDDVSAGTIASALARLVEDPELRAAQAKQARRRCMHLFDIRRASARLDEIYETVLASARS